MARVNLKSAHRLQPIARAVPLLALAQDKLLYIYNTKTICSTMRIMIGFEFVEHACQVEMHNNGTVWIA